MSPTPPSEVQPPHGKTVLVIVCLILLSLYGLAALVALVGPR